MFDALSLLTPRDLLRYGISRMHAADLAFGHGTENAEDEAAFIILTTLNLPLDAFETYLDSRLTLGERMRIMGLFDRRIRTRKPAAYLLNLAYLQGVPFYVDERVIVPRSFISEILSTESGAALYPDPASVTSVLDLCTGSGCLAIMAARHFPNAHVDAVDLSADALAVARRNVAEHDLQHRITLHQGNLWQPLAGRKYDVILTNPPYVDDIAMTELPDEYRHEPSMALHGGADGMDLVRSIIDGAAAHLNPRGSILCELGGGRAAIESTHGRLPFRWIATKNSDEEVFFLTRDELTV